jgi:hypothetical protein
MFLDIQIGVALVFALIIVFLIGNAIYQYKITPGESYLTAFEGSLVLFWSWFSKLVLAAFGFLAVIAGDLGAPQVQTFLTTYCTPTTVAAVGVAAFFILDFAHRTIAKPTSPTSG